MPGFGVFTLISLLYWRNAAIACDLRNRFDFRVLKNSPRNETRRTRRAISATSLCLTCIVIGSTAYVITIDWSRVSLLVAIRNLSTKYANLGKHERSTSPANAGTVVRK